MGFGHGASIRIDVRFLGEGRLLSRLKPQRQNIRRTDIGVGIEWMGYETDLLSYFLRDQEAGTQGSLIFKATSLTQNG